MNFSQTFIETFSGSNQNPINPAKWQTPPALDPLQQISNLLEPVVSTHAINGATYIGAVAPNNQYVQATVHQLTNTGLLQLALRSSSDLLNGYVFSIQDNGNGTADMYLAYYINNAETILLDIGDLPFAANDVFAVGIDSTTLEAFQNGTSLGSVNTGTFSSGSWGVFIQTSVNSDLQISSFSGGETSGSDAVGWSPVDCRDYATFPNDGLVQSDGSVFYIGQESSNSSVPGVDSNSEVPGVDSRTDGPTNSRVNPLTR